MSLETSQANTHQQIDNGPALQVLLNQASLNFNGSNATGLIPSCGYTKFAFSATSTIAGTITIQRYLDEAGTIPQGPALTGTLTANANTTVNCVDGAPFGSLTIAISGGGVLSNTALLFQAQ